MFELELFAFESSFNPHYTVTTTLTMKW